ncbi:hypothetical protein AAFF_G00077660 [Aldrovandia affinis]|uniref:Uncharacterized protein n=1 Tax=Aldrovandia affinis TaxID=143900 RepID=A0AAD7RXJ0_9TELE|nr:hypothetical protein AAFF_G00077660 [Aldrovandia affinis]
MCFLHRSDAQQPGSSWGLWTAQAQPVSRIRESDTEKPAGSGTWCVGSTLVLYLPPLPPDGWSCVVVAPFLSDELRLLRSVPRETERPRDGPLLHPA